MAANSDQDILVHAERDILRDDSICVAVLIRNGQSDGQSEGLTTPGFTGGDDSGRDAVLRQDSRELYANGNRGQAANRSRPFCALATSTPGTRRQNSACVSTIPMGF